MQMVGTRVYSKPLYDLRVDAFSPTLIVFAFVGVVSSRIVEFPPEGVPLLWWDCFVRWSN
jgi:hypothetical protein